jgi:uncharacterized protein
LTVCATALPGTALPILDFDPYLACQTIPAGRTTATISVRVRGDRVREPDERLTVVVAGLGGVRLTDPSATGTIRNDD